MLLDIQKKLLSRSDRVKGVDFHPTEPWLLTGLYNGSVHIYDHTTGALVKSFEVAEVPVRCVKFIARKNWFVAGSDDFQLRVFNYNTHEKVVGFEAHPDYIRCLAVHPAASVVLTGSDDMTIKAWDWEKGWKNVQVYEGHTHFIMNLVFNPKDPNTFASACLDRTVKMWSLTSPTPNSTLDAHEKGVNYIDFYPGSDKPYLVTCGDDKTVRVWDYLSKSCVQTMEGHTNNVSFAVFHPALPVVVSGSEDGTVKVWNSGTYRVESTLSYALERAWCVALRKDANEVAVGFDDGVVVISLGRDEPTFSMDTSGKLIYTRNHDVLSANLQTLPSPPSSSSPSSPDSPSPAAAAAIADGTRLALSPKDLGSTELFASSLTHSPNGRFVAALGDGEYIIYTALAWRNKAFGAAISFAWAADSNTYAVLESRVKIKIFRSFRERPGVGVKGVGGGGGGGAWSVDGLFGGVLLGAKGAGFVMFWDWESGEVVRRIDVDAKNVYWSGTNTLLAITSSDTFYILRFDRAAYDARVDAGGMEEIADEGVEEAFEVVAEVNESTLYLLGYIPAHNRVYLADKELNVYGYALSLAVVEYQTAVLRGDMDAASEILPSVPKEQVNKVARFLEGRDLKELALEITTDPEHKFDLALALSDLSTALSIARASPPSESAVKFKALGDRALGEWRFEMARECFERAGDVGALMLLMAAVGGREGLEGVAREAAEKGQNNLAFAVTLLLGDAAGCVDLLIRTQRAPEAALFARTYAPRLVPKAVAAWKTDLTSKNRGKIAGTIADPAQNPELFVEGWEDALAKEEEALAVWESEREREREREKGGVLVDVEDS
ncbi:Coatomer subunit beta' [Psilocybe cubensis]|uniref:Coatomer subunit beta' n=2 Tax=Psilocybe cubensis TaxID=181762 RepID=A0A8H7XXL5_PSICU|nr:Coatomer subunit beta' [Psilocybe cubensis]KAH9482103.1 Coatomer subunit beta' [Psilocybe cubensis]